MDAKQRFDIVYTTRFRYAAPVRESHNEVRACPLDDERQRVLDYSFRTEPFAVVQSFRDYWGTRVEAFGIRGLHQELVAVAESSVETVAMPPPEAVGTTLDDIRTALREAHFDELVPTAATTCSSEMARVADQLDSAASDPLDVVGRIRAAVREQLDYRGGVTNVTTTAAEAWKAGAGVCQDFAHAAVALARWVGLPARYVSGFLFTSSDATGVVPDDTHAVEVQTHAWAEFAVEPGRWVPIDPTNGLPVRQFHVKIGHGRHYDDVSPFHGSYLGGEGAQLDAVVAMRRAGEGQTALPPRRPAAPDILGARAAGQLMGGRAQQQQQQQQQ